MEIHRLKPMKENYPVDLFNKLYEETKGLRKNLTYQIDARRYGVTPDIIESWFDDKFIFVFNKHFDNKDPEVLKGFIINSLKTFKLRILRKAYNKEGEFYQSVVELEGDNELINIIPDPKSESTESIFYNLAVEFMKKKLSDDAFLLFQVQLDPPPYIINKLGKTPTRIPNDIIIDFFELHNKPYEEAEKYIKKLKKEISKAIKNAREHFKNVELAF